MQIIFPIAIILGTLAGMESFSWFIHKYLFHGPLWFIEPDRGSCRTTDGDSRGEPDTPIGSFTGPDIYIQRDNRDTFVSGNCQAAGWSMIHRLGSIHWHDFICQFMDLPVNDRRWGE